ncbi:putative RNA-directed DNA polymerase [Tanacetum coccineum]
MVGVGPSVDSVSNLDCSNVLHLQNSDFNVTNVISIKLSGTENYRVWAAAMRLAINTRNKTGFIDGTCLKETYASSAVYSSQWDRCNSIVLSWLLNSVSDDLYLGQIFSENASEVWSELKETYDKLDGSVTLNLLNKIHNFKQGELTVSEYYHKLNSLWREFDIMTKLPKCSCAAREDVLVHNQLMKLMQFLMGLNDVYQPIRSSILSRENLPEVKDAFAIISREESHRGIASTSSGSLAKPQISGFVSSTNNWSNNGNKKNNNKKFSHNNPNYRGPNPNLKCTNCEKTGHTGICLRDNSKEWNSGDDQLRLRWMIYLVVLADAAESVRDAIGFEYCLASSSGWTKSPVLWAEIGESSLTGLELPLEFEVGDRVLLKVTPWKGVVRFGKKGKLAPRYVGPFEILERIGLVAYRLRLPEELNSVHDTFHVSNLKKCLADANLHVPLDEIKVDKTLRFVEEPMMKLMNLINDVPSGSNTGNIQANLAGRCTYMNSNVLFNLNFKTFFNTNTILCKASLRWIIDSGANQHMTISTINMFGIVDVSDLSLTVGHPNGTLAKVKFVGNLKLNSHVTLYDVLVVPEYCVSLLSVNKLLKDSKLFVGFTESKCYIQDLVHSQIVGTGSENGGLYLFDYDSPKSSMCSNIGNMSAVCYVSKSLWHSRLGHPSDQALDVLQGNLRFTKNSSKSPCDICHKAKQTREPFPLSEHKTTNIGDLVHLDLWGPYKVVSKDGFRYFLTIVDDYTRGVWIYLLKTKDEVFDLFTSFINHIQNQFKCSIKTVRSDNGTEFVNNKMALLFNNLGIVHQTSCAYTPQQNGIAERKHRHLLNVARSLLFQSGIPLSMWPECILTAAYLVNRLPSSVLNGKSPFELVYRVKPNLSHLRSFGCLCYSTVLNNSDKFSSRSEKCVLIGFSSTKKAYKVYGLDSKVVFYSRDLKFYETIYPYKMNKSFQNIVFDSSNNKVDTLNFFNDNQTPSPNDEGRGLNNSAPNEGDNSYSEGNVPSSSNVDTIRGEPENSSQVQPDLRRSSRTSKQPARFNDFVVGSSKLYGLEKYVTYVNLSRSNFCFFTTLNKTTKPTTYDEAIKNPKWIESMNNEIEALLRNNTWTVCDLPKGRKPVGSKWLWKIKFKSTGEIERCMLNVAICNGWDLFQLDVNNAFLYGDLTEEAPRQWNAKLTMTLVENGFVQSKYDYSLFTKTSGDMVLMLLVYVDDIVITGNDNSEIGKFKEILKSKFQIKDLGNLKYFLGIEVLDNDDGVCLSQRKYCLEVLHEYGLLAGRPVETPLAENTTLNHVESEDDKLLSDIGNYQKLVGKLIYLTNTRPDISYAVHCLSQFMHAPLSSHLEAAFRVLRYLKNSPGSGIQINKVGNLKLRAYADSDWARCPATRKSVSGYCVFLGSSLITWKSKKQSTLSRSSAEAEYRSMASATCEVIWLSNLLGDMGVKNDNSFALQIAANPVFHEKSKHFEIDVHLVREKVASGVIVTEKIHTSQQIADVLTKALGSKQHDELCTKIEQRCRILQDKADTQLRRDMGDLGITLLSCLVPDTDFTELRSAAREETFFNTKTNNASFCKASLEEWIIGFWSTAKLRTSLLGFKANSHVTLYDVLLSQNIGLVHRNMFCLLCYVFPIFVALTWSPTDQALDVLQGNLRFTKNSSKSPCDICHKAKQTREPFPLSEHKTTNIGDLVHLDLWGPYKVVSKGRLPSSVLNGKSPLSLCTFKPNLPTLGGFASIALNFYNDNQTPSPHDEGRSKQRRPVGWRSHPDHSDGQDEGDVASMGDNSYYEGNVPSSSNVDTIRGEPENSSQVQPDLRRSSRTSKQPARFNNFVVGSSKLYGLEKYVTYANLSRSNFCSQAMECQADHDLIIDNDDGVCLSQRKYCLEVLHEYGLLAGRPVETPLAENTTLNHVESEDDKLLSDIGNYQKLVGKLIYLTNTRPDISYAVHCLSQFMHAPLSSHLEAAFRVLRYLKNSPGSGIQINKFLDYLEKIKQQSTIDRTSAKMAEYSSMATATCYIAANPVDQSCQVGILPRAYKRIELQLGMSGPPQPSPNQPLQFSQWVDLKIRHLVLLQHHIEDMKREIIVHSCLENCGDDDTLFVGTYKNLPTMIKILRVDEVDIGCLEKRLELNRLSEHQNVVRFYDIEADETYLYWAFERCNYSLDQYCLLNQDTASEELL